MNALVLAAVAAACGACGAAAAPPLALTKPSDHNQFGAGPPLVTPGERMAYRLQLRGLDLAEFTLGAGDVAELGGRTAVLIQGHARTVGLAEFVARIDDRFTSWIDVETGRSLRFVTDEYETNSKANVEHALIDLVRRSATSVPVEFHMNDVAAAVEPQQVSLPDVWDYNAFLIALRSWEAPIGTMVATEVFRSRFLWHVDVRVAGRENIVTELELGEVTALRFDALSYKLTKDGKRFPGSDSREFSIWISDDDGRVPLQIVARTDYGDMKMKITDYQPGVGARLRK